MKLFEAKKIALAALLTGVMAVSACSTGQVIDNSVDVAAGTTKLVAKGAVGAGKLAYRGGHAPVADDE